MPLTLIHGRLANTVILYLIALTIWAFWRFFRKEGMSPNYRGALIISMLLIFFQTFLGGILWLGDSRPDSTMHLLYGIIGVIGIPAVYVFTKERQNRYEMLLIGTGLLFLIGIVFRLVATGRV